MAKEGTKRVNLTGIPVRALCAELGRRKAKLTKLIRRYERMIAQVNALRTEIDALGGLRAMRAIGDRRQRNSSTLPSLMRSALAGKRLTVDEVTQAVLDRGYITSSPNLRAIVNKTLITNQAFKRVSRGVYTLR